MLIKRGTINKEEFLRRIDDWIGKDIKLMKKSDLNMPLALCTLSYMDFFGSFLTGLTNAGSTEDNLREYIDKCFDKSVKSSYRPNLLKKFRDTLAHDYFSMGGISKGSEPDKIYSSFDGLMILNVTNLSNDFLNSIPEFKDLIINDINQKFEYRMKNIENKIDDAAIKYQGSHYISPKMSGAISSSSVIVGHNESTTNKKEDKTNIEVSN